ncbi:MAG: putative iron-sulfur cluster-binding metallochaperone, partial [Bacillota bacterium]
QHITCPRCGTNGKRVETITLKSLLLPDALAKLEPNSHYQLCVNPDCGVAYFNENAQSFLTEELKVPVFQKTGDENCPVCYCFGWTRANIRQEIEEIGKCSAVTAITEHIKAGRCGCDVNNPQGSCCLGNVRKVALTFTEAK